MLPERIMHECLKQLLRDSDNDNPAEEDLESLCKLITTIGKDLEGPQMKLRDSMNSYFEKMGEMSSNQKLPSRFRFMLKVYICLSLLLSLSLLNYDSVRT